MPLTRSSTSSTSNEYSPALTYALTYMQTLYEAHVLPHLPAPIQTLSNQLITLAWHIYPTLTSTISLVTNLAQSSDNALLSFGILLITLYLGLRVADYLRRAVIGWILLFVKLGLLLVLVQTAVYMNSYGLDKTIRDAAWFGGLVWEFFMNVMDGNELMAETSAAGGRGGRGRGGQNTTPRGLRSRSDRFRKVGQPGQRGTRWN